MKEQHVQDIHFVQQVSRWIEDLLEPSRGPAQITPSAIPGRDQEHARRPINVQRLSLEMPAQDAPHHPSRVGAGPVPGPPEHWV